ncbi:trehalose-phosphatase [Microbacterium luticocti]|uniref:trehalose-phosphatase n=1 Tax=Microbacterium luticocti TaxID=451764 RepID=UPI00041060EC|nr:trehalose-phosphatase [Microbacterium luticocti]
MTPVETRALDRLAAARRLLVALDFDGTLSPLQNDPMRSRMLPAARTAVEALAGRPCTWVALVSGRSLKDLRLIAEHRDDSAVLLAGSHGAEFWTPAAGVIAPDDDPADIVLRDRLRAATEQATRHLPGVWIEPKTFGFGVHTRRASRSDAQAANDAADAIVATAAGHWRRRTGRDIVEYAFRDEGKDSAVAHLRQLVHADAVLFAGDDVTDEDALRSLGETDVGVHVGPVGTTAATVLMPGIDEFARFLASLAARRRDRACDESPA